MSWQRRPLPSAAERCEDPEQARQRALSWLADRDYSSGGLYEKLCRFYTARAAAYAVAEMVDRGYLDDERYARNQARLLYGQHRSRRIIGLKLAEKGVERDLAARVLDELYEEWGEELAAAAEWRPEQPPELADPETAAAAALVEKQYRSKLQAGRPDLVLAALQRRGFSYRAARAAVAAVAAQQE